jgi:hypothetical protein
VWLLTANLAQIQRPEWGVNPRPYVMIMVAGFVIGVAGHLFRSRMMILAGVLAVFAGTVLLPLVTFLSKSS